MACIHKREHGRVSALTTLLSECLISCGAGSFFSSKQVLKGCHLKGQQHLVSHIFLYYYLSSPSFSSPFVCQTVSIRYFKSGFVGELNSTQCSPLCGRRKYILQAHKECPTSAKLIEKKPQPSIYNNNNNNNNLFAKQKKTSYK